MAQGTNVGQIFLQLSIQNNVASQIAGQSRLAASQAGSAFSAGAASIAGMAKKFIAGAAVTALVSFGKQAIDVASDLQEVQNVVDTAFGDMAYQCEEFAKTASTQFGISELQAKKMASTFMSMSTGMGLSGEAASKMSINVAKLSADVASFYNLSADEASTKLKAIWTGETEGLKDLGVVMTQTNLQAYAMSKGINKNIADMTQAEQTTLRYNFVMEQLSLAQGDFAKTSNSWSNSVKSMGENLRTAMGNIGAILIQVFTPVLQVLSEIISKFAELTGKAANAVSKIFGTESTQEAVNNINASGKEMASAVEETNKEIENAAMGLAGFDQLYTIGNSEAEGSSMDATAAFGDIQDYKSAEVEREGLLDKFGNKIIEVYKKIEPYVRGFYNTFIDPFVKGITFCINYIKTKFEPVKDIFSGIFKSVSEGVSYAFSIVSEIFMNVWNTLGKFWESYGKPIFQGIVDAAVGAFSVVRNIIETVVMPLFQKFFSVIKNLWDNHGAPLFKALLGFIGEIGLLITTVWNNIVMPLANWIVDTFGPAIVGVISWIWDKTSAVGGFFMDVFSGILTFLSVVVSSMRTVIEDGFIGTIEKLFTSIGTLFSSLWELVKTPINWIIEGVNKVIGALNSLSIDVPDWVPGLGGQTWGFNIPEIQMLAEGGIVDQPTLNIAGEAGPEAITPIDKLEAMIARVVAETMAKMNITKEEPAQEITIPLTVNLGNKTVVKEVVTSINRQSKINGKSVIINI